MDYVTLITQLAGAMAGQAASALDRAEAMRLIKAAIDEFGKIDVPKLQQLLLKTNPDTQLKGIKDDPVYRDQQNAADTQLGDIVQSGGLTLADRAALNDIRNRTAQSESAGRNAIAGQMAARGTLDSGAQLAMQLQGNQQSANSLARADESAAAQAQARAFQAIQERARNAGQGLDRDYRQKSDAARAQDAINAGNTAIQNTASMYNAGLPQQNFQNQMSLAQAKLDPTYTLSDAHKGQAQNTQGMWQGFGNIAGAALKSAGSSSSNTGSQGLGYDEGAAANVPAWKDPVSSPGEWTPYPGSSSGAMTSEPNRDQSDGSENYEVDPATGRIRRKTSQAGQNF